MRTILTFGVLTIDFVSGIPRTSAAFTMVMIGDTDNCRIIAFERNVIRIAIVGIR